MYVSERQPASWYNHNLDARLLITFITHSTRHLPSALGEEERCLVISTVVAALGLSAREDSPLVLAALNQTCKRQRSSVEKLAL